MQNIEPKPPGSVCPICGNIDVDILDGKGRCTSPSCLAEFMVQVRIEVSNYTSQLNRWQRIKFWFRSKKRELWNAYKKVWCVHEWQLRSVDMWEDELEFSDAITEGSLRTIVTNIPPYFVCKHCDKRVEGK